MYPKKLVPIRRNYIGHVKNKEFAYIENIKFENLSINLNVNRGVHVTAAALAINANNTTLKNVSFDGLRIDTGKGDDGAARYIISDLIGNGNNNQFENVTGINVEISASEFADVNSVFLKP